MDWLTLVATAFLASVLFIAVQRWFQKAKSGPPGTRPPPGPPGRPFVGHTQFANTDFHCNQAMKWAEQYGPVYRIKTGSADMVILNNFDSIKKFLTKKEILYRSQNLLFQGKVYSGVATLNGEAWTDNRRFCLHVLRDLGFGKTSMEEHVKEECQCLVEKIGETKGGPIAIQEYIYPSTSNNIAALVYGSRYPFEHPRRRYLDELLRELLKAIRAGTLVEFLPPFVRKIVSKLPSTRRTVIVSKLVEFMEYTKEQVEEHKLTIDENFNRDFIDGYLKKIKEHENDPASNFLPRFLLGNVSSFFIAGSTTVAVTIHWHMLNFANNADTLQARVQREIDEVVGRERQPTWEDRNKMSFTMACIWEMNRWKTIAPLGVPRGAGEDTVFDDYYIPKGTTIIPNIWAVHNDPKLWREPSKFDPTRFLNEDGTLTQPKPEYLIPFSIGKRMCPGEILASVEIFLYITCLLQKYRILPKEGKIHNLNDIDVPLLALSHHKLTFTPR